MQNPLSEEEKEYIDLDVEYAILKSDSSEMNSVGEQLKLVFELQAEFFLICK